MKRYIFVTVVSIFMIACNLTVAAVAPVPTSIPTTPTAIATSDSEPPDIRLANCKDEPDPAIWTYVGSKIKLPVMKDGVLVFRTIKFYENSQWELTEKPDRSDRTLMGPGEYHFDVEGTVNGYEIKLACRSIYYKKN